MPPIWICLKSSPVSIALFPAQACRGTKQRKWRNHPGASFLILGGLGSSNFQVITEAPGGQTTKKFWQAIWTLRVSSNNPPWVVTFLFKSLQLHSPELDAMLPPVPSVRRPHVLSFHHVGGPCEFLKNVGFHSHLPNAIFSAAMFFSFFWVQVLSIPQSATNAISSQRKFL